MKIGRMTVEIRGGRAVVSQRGVAQGRFTKADVEKVIGLIHNPPVRVDIRDLMRTRDYLHAQLNAVISRIANTRSPRLGSNAHAVQEFTKTSASVGCTRVTLSQLRRIYSQM